ncbi:Plastid ribosomal protein L6 large ribosomal subunit [Pleodorina starrii]|uniref:Plastid ribosomal protein L6 large ribosomal subunit n=1 Tax=Pleodorina starrii TaxID=330485 RepID=A0A9W6BVA5_9CHLO|nr:Plastid ribosomal protein L6 large ribosomal subunit [Pleodorina starrii]GLC58713.1 Plastid ribosomal protein L6 large ribosomal subunit [Pleodorina starrii]GLC75202.1 Plastid ribosomal protein L6 large ribosomal subunit [Pleodorina starrii]
MLAHRVQPFRAAAPSRRRLSVVCKDSRIGRAPIVVPKGVTVTLEGNLVRVKGPNGTLEQALSPRVKIEQVDGKLKLSKLGEDRVAMSQHGLSRTLVNNIVTGVSTGFEKRMEMVGTGYRASVAGKELTLNVGYSKPRVLAIPEGLKVAVEKNTALVISGANKVEVGDFCATIRRQRPPEPYKGKGIRYSGEVIKLKEGKGAGGKKK